MSQHASLMTAHMLPSPYGAHGAALLPTPTGYGQLQHTGASSAPGQQQAPPPPFHHQLVAVMPQYQAPAAPPPPQHQHHQTMPQMMTSASVVPAASTTPGRSAAAGGFSMYPPSASSNLYVGHLPSELRDSELRALFVRFGEIVSAKVMLNIRTGESRGIGFVKFRSTDDARRAISEMHDCPVTKAIAACQSAATAAAAAAVPNADGSPQVLSPEAAAAHGPVFAKLSTGGWGTLVVRLSDCNADYNPGEPTSKIFVRNVPLDVTEDALFKHFSKFGVVVGISFQDDTTSTAERQQQQQQQQAGSSSGNPSPATSSSNVLLAQPPAAAPTAAADAAAPAAPPPTPVTTSTGVVLLATRIVYITFESVDSAVAAAEATHDTLPFPSCQVPVLSKVAESFQRRQERLSEKSTRAATRTPGGAAAVGSSRHHPVSTGSLTQQQPLPMGLYTTTSPGASVSAPVFAPQLVSFTGAPGGHPSLAFAMPPHATPPAPANSQTQPGGAAQFSFQYITPDGSLVSATGSPPSGLFLHQSGGAPQSYASHQPGSTGGQSLQFISGPAPGGPGAPSNPGAMSFAPVQTSPQGHHYTFAPFGQSHPPPAGSHSIISMSPHQALSTTYPHLVSMSPTAAAQMQQQQQQSSSSSPSPSHQPQTIFAPGPPPTSHPYVFNQPPPPGMSYHGGAPSQQVPPPPPQQFYMRPPDSFISMPNFAPATSTSSGGPPPPIAPTFSPHGAAPSYQQHISGGAGGQNSSTSSSLFPTGGGMMMSFQPVDPSKQQKSASAPRSGHTSQSSSAQTSQVHAGGVQHFLQAS